ARRRLLPHLLDEIGTVDKADASPFPCPPQRDITADALRRPGHHGSLAGEAARIGRPRDLTHLPVDFVDKARMSSMALHPRSFFIASRARRFSAGRPMEIRAH